GIYSFLRRLRVKKGTAAFFGGLFMVVYCLMTGMGVSAQRAVIMYVLRMYSLMRKRTYDMPTALAFTVGITVNLEPLILLRSGFYLSYGAVMGIALIFPVLYRKKTVIGRKLGLWEKIWDVVKDTVKGTFMASLSVSLFLLPILLWFYYEVPVYSCIINIFILPFMSLVMGALVVSLIPGFGIVGTLVGMILIWYEKICRIAVTLPHNSFNPGKPGAVRVIVYYGLLFGAVYWIEKYSESLRKHKTGRAQNATKESEKFDCDTKTCSDGRMHGKISEIKLRISKLAIMVPILVFLIQAGRSDFVSWLYVGQGDGCVMSVGGKAYIFDCGSSSKSDVGEDILIPFLKINGINEIEGIFVSHMDKDHINGLQYLLETRKENNMKINNLFLPDVGDAKDFEPLTMLLSDEKLKRADGSNSAEDRMLLLDDEKSGKTNSSNLGENPGITNRSVSDEKAGKTNRSVLGKKKNGLFGAAKQNKTKITRLAVGDVYKSKTVDFTVVSPDRASSITSEDSVNENSLCLYVQIKPKGRSLHSTEATSRGNLTILFTGDISGEGEDRMLKNLKDMGIRGADILKVAHHGSDSSTSADFLKNMNFKIGVISCGLNNSYGHPHKEVLERLNTSEIEVFRTDQAGCVTIAVKNKKIKITTFSTK
nr:ComEC/Rec2 family competence protein [Lachnospiraceae bacterium]